MSLNTPWREARSSAPPGIFPRPPARVSRGELAKHDGVRVAAELDRIWRMQQALDMPQHKLNELVIAALESIRPMANDVGMAPWVDMLCAIQHGIDGETEQARCMANAISDARTERGANDARQVVAKAVAHFYIGLLEASPLRHAAHHASPQTDSAAAHLARHRRAQVPTKGALAQLQHMGVKPPQELAPLIAMMATLSSALHDLPPPPGGYLHMILPATADTAHSCECLFAYGLTQLSKGRTDRAAFAMEVCNDSAMRRGHRLMAALIQPVWLHCLTDVNPSADHADRAALREAILERWNNQGQHGDAAPDTNQETIRRADRIQRALAFIAAHIDVKFTATELANACGVSSRTVSEDFRAVFHKTVLAYVTEERMRTALALLQDRSLPLEVVASKVGFQSSFGFSKAFFRTYGHMPTRPMSCR